jgi:hypothetical protein
MSFTAAALLAEEGHHEVNRALSFGIGGIALGILMFALIALVMFGGGRDHT